MRANYTKLKDETWGLRITLEGKETAPVKGTVVSVVTKGGETRQVTVDRVLWTGTSENGENVVLAKPLEKQKEAENGAAKEAVKETVKVSGLVCPHCGAQLSVSVAA